MEKFNELERLISSMKEDATKIFTKGNKAAGVRLRKNLQDVKILAQQIRDEVQLVKEV